MAIRPSTPSGWWRATNWSHSNQFNTAAFTAPKLAFGTCPRNYVRGTGYLHPDLGLVKNTKLTEHLNWEFRGEVFNVPNHPNFTNPGGQVNGYSFGAVSYTHLLFSINGKSNDNDKNNPADVQRLTGSLHIRAISSGLGPFQAGGFAHRR